MKSTNRPGPASGFTAAVTAGLLTLAIPFADARAEEKVSPDALRILQAMSSYMTALKGFTVDFRVESEVVDSSGQKLEFNSAGEVAVQRPNRLYSRRKGAATDGEMYFDGKTVTLLGRTLNGYAQIPGPTTIEQALESVRSLTDLDLPAADLLYPDPATGLLTDVQGGVHLGRDDIDGVPCDHLAFRANKVDWQIWVRTGDTPVPLKYVITSKWITGAPQYSLHLVNWNLQPKPDARRFEFVPPKGAKQHPPESVKVNELGEVSEMEAR
ncbi:MAG: hypothetical protein RL653_1780 [Pseudomonadota bacterium]